MRLANDLAEPIWFSLTVKPLIGPRKVLNYLQPFSEEKSDLHFLKNQNQKSRVDFLFLYGIKEIKRQIFNLNFCPQLIKTQKCK